MKVKNQLETIHPIKNAAENNDSILATSEPTFNPTVQLKRDHHSTEATNQLKSRQAYQMQAMEEEEEMLQAKRAPFQMQEMEEEEEMVQAKQAPFQMQEEEEEEAMMPKMKTAQLQEEEEEEMLQAKQAPFQMQEEEEEEAMMPKMKTTQFQEEEEEEMLQAKKRKNSQGKKKSNSASKTSLPENVQAKMESSFSSDFSGVNIYSDSSKAENMGAQAFAQGSDIHFAPGKYDPQTQSGQELLGHELTHIVQQREGRVQPTTQRKGNNINDNPTLEHEADSMGRKAAKGESTGFKSKDNKSSNQNNQPVQGFFKKIKNVFKKAGKAVKNVAKGIGGKISSGVKTGVKAVKNVASNIWGSIKKGGGVLARFISKIGGGYKVIIKKLLSKAGNVAGIIKKVTAKSAKVIISFLSKMLGIGGIGNKIKGIIQKLREKVKGSLEWVIGKGSKVWKWIKPKIVAARNKIKGGAKKLINFVISMSDGVRSKVDLMIDWIISKGSSLWQKTKSNLQIFALYFQKIVIPDGEILGSYQANQAQNKLWAMDPIAFIKFYKSTLAKAKSNSEKQYIFKALAAGNSVSAIQTFAGKIRGKSVNWMRNNLRLTRQTDGKGLRQSWNDSCGPTTVQAIQGELDPIYALSLRNSNGSNITDGNGVVMGPNVDVIEDQRDMLQSNGGVAVSRGSAGGQGMGMGAMMTLIKNRTGIDYTTTGASNKNTALNEIDNILGQGLPVPIRVGASASAPWGGGHFSLITHKSGSTYNFHDVWQGQSYGRTKANFTTNTMNIANWQIFTHYGKPASDD